jgi:capsular polysaccharide biosynthesis protein
MRSSLPVKVQRATWVIERVYHNYSHWLTAHLPKLLLLKSRDMLDDVLLPPDRPAFVDDSMRAVGIEPEQFATFDPSRPLRVAELTVLETDRFRPELLRSVREAVVNKAERQPWRRLYVSRAKASRRRLLNEDELWPLLEQAGFERVFLEDHPFDAQVRLMQEAAVVVAPHGAGLTNVMFCAPGTGVVEIADLSFPNPNFYAVASAAGLRYAIVEAEGVGDVHPLEKDLRVDVAAVSNALECILS